MRKRGDRIRIVTGGCEIEAVCDCYRNTGTSLICFDQVKSLTVCRRTLPDMTAIPVAIQRGTFKRLEDQTARCLERQTVRGLSAPARSRGILAASTNSTGHPVGVPGASHRNAAAIRRRACRKAAGDPFRRSEASPDLSIRSQNRGTGLWET